MDWQNLKRVAANREIHLPEVAMQWKVRNSSLPVIYIFTPWDCRPSLCSSCSSISPVYHFDLPVLPSPWFTPTLRSPLLPASPVFTGLLPVCSLLLPVLFPRINLQLNLGRFFSVFYIWVQSWLPECKPVFFCPNASSKKHLRNCIFGTSLMAYSFQGQKLNNLHGSGRSILLMIV